MIEQVGIIGAGAIGGALGGTLKKAGLKVEFWDPKQGATVGSVAELVKHSQWIIICAPSKVNRQIASQIAEALGEGSEKILVSTVAKGVESGFITMDQVLKDESHGHYDSSVLYGPMLAAEITAGKKAYAILALENANWQSEIKPTLGELQLTFSEDIKSISLCGVAKNIYALAFGINDGLSLGLNSKGKLASLVLKEMKTLLKAFEADPYTALGVSGLGDLLATGWSEESYNHRIGKALAENLGGDEAIAGEGALALQELGKRLDISKLPIIAKLADIVTGKSRPPELGELIDRL